MTSATADPLSLTFSALADPTRRAILARLAEGEATVGELAQPHAMSLPSISRHLKVLERAGLVVKGRSAQWRPCRLEPAPLAEADAWMAPTAPSSSRASRASQSNSHRNKDRRIHDARRPHAPELHADLGARRTAGDRVRRLDRSGPARLVLQPGAAGPGRADRARPPHRRRVAADDGDRRGDVVLHRRRLPRDRPERAARVRLGRHRRLAAARPRRPRPGPAGDAAPEADGLGHQDDAPRRASRPTSRTTACPTGGRCSAGACRTRSTASPPSSVRPRRET